jgi:hypothetical protein
MLPDERPSPEQIEILRAKTPAERLDLALWLRNSALKLKRAGLVSLHPEWTEEQVERELYRVFLFARS